MLESSGARVRFLGRTASHVHDLATSGLDAYRYAPQPFRIFFTAPVALDPLVVALGLWRRPNAPVVAATVDLLGNWISDRQYYRRDPGWLLGGFIQLTAFTVFVVARALPLRLALALRDSTSGGS